MANLESETKTPPPVNGASTVASSVASAVTKPPVGERGISGTANYSGDILAESNNELIHQEAYGQAGSRQWGKWEEIVRTDEAVAKALDFVIAPVRDARVDIEPVDDTPEEVAKADFIRFVIETVEPGWPEFLNQTCRGSLGCGFALHELVWSGVAHETLPGGKGYAVTKLAERLPSSVHPNGWIEVPGGGELASIKQLGPKGSRFETVELPASKVLLNSWNRNGDNYLGFSAFRAVYYLCKIRRELARIIAISHVREACGIPVCYADEAASEMTKDQRASMETFMKNVVYHENANIILPRGWKLDWLFSKGADKSSVLGAFDSLGLKVLEQVGAQQIYLGTSGTGSRAVGDTHASQSDVFTNGLLGHLSAILNGVGARPYTGLVRKLVDANWGAPKSGKYPVLKLTPKKAKLNVKERFEAMKLAKDAGLLTITAEDENEAREELGLSPIDAKDRDEAKEKAKAFLPPVPPPFGGQPSTAAAPVALPPVAKASRLSLSFGATTFTARRELRASEQHLDLAAISNTFDTSRDDFADGIRPLVAEALMRALPDVKAAMADGDATDVGAVPLDMARIDAFVGKYLEGLRAEGYRQVRGEMRRAGAAPKAVKLASEEDDQYQPPSSTPPSVAEKTLAPMRKHLVRKIQNRLTSDMEKEAIDALRTGGDPEDVIASTLEFQTSTGAFRADAGLVTTKAFSIGRDEFAAEYGDQVESCELSAILDNGTCGPCDRLDGTEFDFGSAEDEELTPPLSSQCDGGDNCRCIKIFNFKRGGDE